MVNLQAGAGLHTSESSPRASFNHPSTSLHLKDGLIFRIGRFVCTWGAKHLQNTINKLQKQLRHMAALKLAC
jgi:hypothetical protein